MVSENSPPEVPAGQIILHRSGTWLSAQREASGEVVGIDNWHMANQEQ